MGTPFKMKAHTLPGPNQEKTPKKVYTDDDRKRAVKLSKEHENDPGFKEWRDEVFGGKTTVKGSVSTVRRPA